MYACMIIYMLICYLCMFNHVLLYSVFQIRSRLKSSKELMLIQSRFKSCKELMLIQSRFKSCKELMFYVVFVYMLSTLNENYFTLLQNFFIYSLWGSVLLHRKFQMSLTNINFVSLGVVVHKVQIFLLQINIISDMIDQYLQRTPGNMWQYTDVISE